MANLSNINDKFLVTTGGNVLIGQTSAVGSSILQVTGNSTFAGAGTFSSNIFMSTNGSILRNTGGSLQLQSDSSSIILRSNNTTALTIDTSQNATFAGKITQSVSSGGTAATFTNSDATNGYGVAIQSEGTSNTRYALVLRNLDSSNVYGGVSTMTNQVGFWGIGASPIGTLGSRLTVGGNASIGTSYTGTAAPSNGLIVQGNVGIGVASPVGKLQVSLPTYTNEDTNSQQAIFGVDSGYGVRIGYNETDNKGYINVLKPGVAWGNLILQEDVGKVGIGTTSPARLLQLNSSGQTDLHLTSTSQGVGASDGMTIFLDSSGTGGLWLREAQSLRFATNSSEKMTILSGGNVGIGTTSPGRSLHVIGQVAIANAVDANSTGALLVSCDGTSNKIYSRTVQNVTGAHPIDFIQTSSTVMRIASNGNVGIGTNSPNYKLSVANASTRIVSINYQDSLNTIMSHAGSPNYGLEALTIRGDYIAFYTDYDPSHYQGLERMRIDSSGNVTIGTNNTSQVFNVNTPSLNTSFPSYFSISGSYTSKISDVDIKAVGVLSGGGYGSNLKFFTSNEATVSERMRIDSSGNVTIKAPSSSGGGVLNLENTTTSVNGTDWGSLNFISNDSSTSASGIRASVVGTSTSFNGDGNLVFSTAPSNGTNTERMRITGAGDVLFRATSVPSASNLIGSGFKYDSKSRMTLVQASDNNNLTDLQEYFNTDGAVGKIQTSGNATIFNTNSDYRLKEDLQDFKGLDMVSKIPVYDFKWKTNGRRSYGVMAHELQEILPDAAAGKKDAINEDGSINPQGVDYSKIVPILVKSIQELKADNDSLKARIETLENN